MKAIRTVLYFIVAASLTVSLSGCSVFGLDLQKKYDYDYSVGYDNQLNTTVWEFIQAHPSDFTRFIQAVEYAEIDPAIFNQPNITVFPLLNAAITGVPSTSTSNNQHPGGYWAHNQIGGLIPDSWEYYNKEEVKQLILNHIVSPAISYYEFLSLVPGGERTLFPSKATNGYGYVSFHMLNFSEQPEGGDAITLLYINDFASHYTRLNPSGWKQHLYPTTSNLQASNGSYVHTMNMYLNFPTDEDILSTPIYTNR